MNVSTKQIMISIITIIAILSMMMNIINYDDDDNNNRCYYKYDYQNHDNTYNYEYC